MMAQGLILVLVLGLNIWTTNDNLCTPLVWGLHITARGKLLSVGNGLIGTLCRSGYTTLLAG